MKRPEKISPPAFWLNFFRWFCNRDYVEDIEGDLNEIFERRCLKGVRRARWMFALDVIRLFRPGIIGVKFSNRLIPIDMIGNYIKIAFRSFGRQKAYAFLNVIGLSIGIAASLLILQYVRYERSFDTFHSRAKDIYRIQYNGYQNGQLNFESAVAVPAVGPALKNNFPEVEEYTRFLPVNGVVSFEKPGEQPISFHERKIQYADTNIFKVFDFRLLKGSTRNCLKGTNKVILSRSAAYKYFGNDDPIGQRINLNGDEFSLEVTGIFEDVPENSHIKFDFLISYETINVLTENEAETSWRWYDFYSFVLVKPGTDIQSLQRKWDEFLVKDRTEDWNKTAQRQEFILRPLTDIHLYSNLLYETSPGELRDGDSVYALSIISVLILFIAWVNYVNLATARSFKRANEVGVRKVVGAHKGQLVIQFLIESFLLNVIAAMIALLFVRVLWSSFSSLTGWNIPTAYLMQREFWVLVLTLFFSGALVSGFYPAIILSSFKPITVLKGKIMRSKSGDYLRQGLVVFQFAATFLLISGSLLVFQQLNYMKNKDLGIDLDQTLVVKGPQIIDSLYVQQYEAFKTEVLAIPGIKSISASSSIPGEENYWTSGIQRISPGGPEGRMTITNVAIDHEYVPQYGIRVVAGRNFDKRYPNDKNNVLINESLSRDLGFKSPENAIGEKITIRQDTVEIIGVLADYHQMSLKAKVIPVAFRFFPAASYYSIKLESQNYQAVLNSFAKPWATFFPENPMEYFFLDKFFNRQYERDDRFGKVFTLFTGLAIFTAAIGLLGLSSYMALQRTREIGIRKVFGSSVAQIIWLLSQSLMRPVFVSVLVAVPLGWWVMDKWLQSFPYRTSIEAWVFGVAGILLVVIAFLSVASQALKAAMTKPADTLKYE